MEFLWVDLSRRRLRREEAPGAYRELGGRGLTSRLIRDRVPPTCNPLGPENLLVFAPGLLTGTGLANAGRLSVGAKSPLTGTIKESNAGGTASESLSRLGLSAVVLEGGSQTGKPLLLRLSRDGEAELVAAPECRGMGTYELVARIHDRYGKDHSVLCIGPAGESQMSCASIQSTDTEGRPCRAAGRGGLGAVMGSKGVKALIVERGGGNRPPLADPEGFKQSARSFAIRARTSTKNFRAYGTAMLVGPVNTIGAFPCYNATRGVFDKADAINGERLAGLLKRRGGRMGHKGCSGCVVHCSNEYVDEEGNLLTASLEYETIWSTGGMCGIDDLDAIARMDHLCDDIGVDTMSTGVAMAVAMDAGYRAFGDTGAALEMLEEIRAGSEMGRVLGNGPVSVGAHLRHHRVPVCKGQSIAAYDPRAVQGMAVTYATCPQGADHTAGNVIAESLSGVVDPLSPEGQVELSRKKQVTVMGLDVTGLCLFTGGSADKETLVSLINARLGTAFSEKELDALCQGVLDTERAFNREAGFTEADDRLASFFYEEPLPPHNRVVLIDQGGGNAGPS